MAQRAFKTNTAAIEALRVKRGWTLNQLAAMAIRSSRTLDSLMAGKEAVISTFAKLASALKVEVGELIEGYETKSISTYDPSEKPKRFDVSQLHTFLPVR